MQTFRTLGSRMNGAKDRLKLSNGNRIILLQQKKGIVNFNLTN